MKIHFLSLGWLHMTEEMLYGVGYPNDHVIESPAWAMLIEHPEGLVLIDTGCQQVPEVDPATTFIFSCSQEEVITNQLAGLGYTPEDVTHLILTHSHTDHAGNVHLFKNAKIYIDADEYAHAMADLEKFKAGQYQGPSLAHLARWDDSLNIIPVTEERSQPLPGITLVRFGEGHAYGFLAVVLGEAGRSAIFASDLAYTEEGLKKNPPTLVTNMAGYMAGIDKLIALREEFGAEIWFGHSVDQFNSLKDTTPEF